MLYLEILKAKSELGGYIVNYFSKYFSSVVINGKKTPKNQNNKQKSFNNWLGKEMQNALQKREAH